VNTVTKKEIKISSTNGSIITADISMPKSKTPTAVLVFCHGFKGFKDWGHYNWVAQKSAESGLAFLKFNFSFNGVKTDNLLELSDLNAFAENNYSKELKDLQSVIDYIESNADDLNIDPKRIYLAGHSRGGGIATLATSEDKRIKGLVLWASLSEFDSFFRPETIEDWDKNGVVYAKNSRTGQDLPINKQFYDDYLEHKANLDIRKAAKLISVPLLIIHGEKDETVPLAHAEAFYTLVPHSILIKVEEANHTFGAKHPFDETIEASEMLEELVENTVEFCLD
jgi:dienelactone hydrolase